MPYVYILFSSSLGKFYIGSTADTPEHRLAKHLAQHTGFTGKAKDWALVYAEMYDTVTEARKREFQIKRWKSHKRIQELFKRSSTE